MDLICFAHGTKGMISHDKEGVFNTQGHRHYAYARSKYVMKEARIMNKRSFMACFLLFILLILFSVVYGMAEEDNTVQYLNRFSTIHNDSDKMDEVFESIHNVLEKASIDELIEMRTLIVMELSKRGITSNVMNAKNNKEQDFCDAAVCGGHLSQIDSIVAFGDSIFAGYNIPNEHGVVQQLAESLNVPLYCFAEPGATLTSKQEIPKNVVQQVYDYLPIPGMTPLILIDGGTNDQYLYNLENIGEYGTNDSKTIYGATLNIIQNLISKGIQPWQIVFTTPIPKGIQGDKEYRKRIDPQLTKIGYAMYQVCVGNGCNVINGYHSIFNYYHSYESKIVIMPDDNHPSEIGAEYYANYILNILS